MTLPDFQDPRLRDACRERCAINGEPPCWEVATKAKACGECYRDIGIEPGDEFDEAAAIRRLV